MALFSFTDKSILYFPGCFSLAFLKDKVDNYKKILKKLEINPRFIEEMGCCGGILAENGYEKQLRKIAKENQAFFQDKKILKIITNCPLCLNTFIKEYKTILPSWDLKVEHVIEEIFEKLKQNSKIIKNIFMDSVCYYDSCYLSRYAGLYEQPRDLLRLLGYQVLELPYAKEETLCCGSCSNLPKVNLDLSKKIGSNFIKMIKRKGIKKLVTADAQAYKHLKDLLKEQNIKEIEIFEISDLLCKSLGIKVEEGSQDGKSD